METVASTEIPKEDNQVTIVERRKKKRSSRRKTNSDSCEINPFQNEETSVPLELNLGNASPTTQERNASKPKVVVPSPTGNFYKNKVYNLSLLDVEDILHEFKQIWRSRPRHANV